MHGFDFSDSAISELEEKLDRVDTNGDVRVADFSEDFPYEDDCFEAALAFRSIHHADLETINHSVDEIFRGLKSSGLVYVQVPAYEKLVELKESGKSLKKLNLKLIYLWKFLKKEFLITISEGTKCWKFSRISLPKSSTKEGTNIVY